MAAIDANVFVTCVNRSLWCYTCRPAELKKWMDAVYTDVIPTGFKIIDETFFYTDTAPTGLKTAN